MRLELRESKAKVIRCSRCGEIFNSLKRLQHHLAAEHTPKALGDILTTRDIPHRPKKLAPANGLVRST